MSQVPPSCFDYTFANSGVSVYYGGATMGVCSPQVQTHTYHRSDDIILVGPSGATPGYFEFLDGRFDTAPSGWGS